MVEFTNAAFREGDKLKGASNYYVWALKMRAVLQAEVQWSIIEGKQRPATYPTMIDGETMTEAQLKKKKILACRLLLLSVTEDLIDLIAEYTDPTAAWKALKDQFNVGDQSQILTLMGQLQSLQMYEGGSVEEYIKKARELKNRLSSMGERLMDKNINQLVLNGLPRSFESLIQTLTHIDPNMTFEKLSSTLLSEAHYCQHRTQQVGDDEALAASFQQQISFCGREDG